ncbi:MAG: prephenate dehydrogenase [Kiritimatiellaeota bacterium]|nr:prephenate dehydrogenase [Kiritimatiellota bacterium]
MTVGIIGLGLIGGSLAKAFRARTPHAVMGLDRDAAAVAAAQVQGLLDGVLAPDTLAACDVLVVALPPNAARAFLAGHAGRVGKGALVVDCCGVKRGICAEGFALARKHGFDFVGGHPMAGREYSGFGASQEGLFEGASMIVVPPPDGVGDALAGRVREVFLPLGFGRVVVATAEAHDAVIALTSQLAHVVSNAYVKSPRAQAHSGFSAGSYADLTRVARLNERLWTELFLENGDYLAEEIDFLIRSLAACRDAIAGHDAEALEALLRHGRECKERQDEH